MFSSEGSKPRANNPKKYEKRTMPGTDMISGAETDHKFAAIEKVDGQILDDSPEMIRRQNSRRRDYRNGYKITGDGIYASPISPSGKE